MANINDRMAELRKKAGFTQQEVAELIGTDRSTYACYETGKTLIPVGKLQLLAIVYGVSMDYFSNTNVMKLNDSSVVPPEPQFDDGMTREERICLARIRLYNALGKTDELAQLMEELERCRREREVNPQ